MSELYRVFEPASRDKEKVWFLYLVSRPRSIIPEPISPKFQSLAEAGEWCQANGFIAVGSYGVFWRKPEQKG